MQTDDLSKLEDTRTEDGGIGSELDDSFFFNEDILCELHGKSRHLSIYSTTVKLWTILFMAPKTKMRVNFKLTSLTRSENSLQIRFNGYYQC